MVQKLLGEYSIKRFIKRIEMKKDKIISIKEFKSLFVDILEDNEIKVFNRIFRILAYKFLREEIISYLYTNKKIKQINCMLKYKNTILKGLEHPDQFNTWKIE